MIPGVADEGRCLTDVSDPFRDHPQHASANDVRRNWIVAEYNRVQVDAPAVERPIALHSHDPIGNDKVRTHRGADIENAFVNAGPMKNVLGPAVPCAGNNAEHVLHAEGDACPVVRLYFRHRNDEVRLENGSWKPQVTEA